MNAAIIARWEALAARAGRALDELEARAPFVRQARAFLDEHQTLLLILIIMKWAIGLLVVKYLVG
jgi:hypothetical protein